MLSFKSILFAAAASFASIIVSAVPTPEISNSLNVAQRSPGGLPILRSRRTDTVTPSNAIGVSNTLYPDIDSTIVDIIGQHYRQQSTCQCWRQPTCQARRLVLQKKRLSRNAMRLLQTSLLKLVSLISTHFLGS